MHEVKDRHFSIFSNFFLGLLFNVIQRSSIMKVAFLTDMEMNLLKSFLTEDIRNRAEVSSIKLKCVPILASS